MGADTAAPVRRLLVKLSGEALCGSGGFGIDVDVLAYVASEVCAVHQAGVETAVVIGGGNFFRGVQAASGGMDRVSADHIGMLATVMNALALQQQLEGMGVAARVQSAIAMTPLVETYVRNRALKHLSGGRIVIFAAGTGSPLFSTDTAASLRAVEIGADLLVKATKVDGVYDRDPMRDPTAKRYHHIGYDEVLARRLNVMDATAIALCREHNMPLRVFAIDRPGDLLAIARGEDVGTLVGQA